ncbi:SulP family inorganic anion transporter [Staphylococcus haemolyticus]|uniref:SulP family inorganic anion transporter n=2 Tax=Staphylococcus TaxID=1279 RepID=UPI00311A2450
MATFIMGIILIIFDMCHIDKILNHIPDTVVIGFMNVLGILLLTTQIKYIFGITTATYLSSTFIRFMPAPLIAISVVTLASYFLKPNVQLVHDLAEIRLTFPKISVYTELLNIHALSIITLYALTMSIICVVQTNLTNEMMDVITQSHSNKDREVIGQGLANLFVGLLGGYGLSALVGQSKFNFKMGATTRLATFVTGLFLLSCVVILGTIVGFIPMAVLASVLITISMNTFDRRMFKHLKEAPIKHSIVMFITIILILMSHNLAIGVVIGTLIYYVVHFIFTKKGRPSL